MKRCIACVLAFFVFIMFSGVVTAVEAGEGAAPAMYTSNEISTLPDEIEYEIKKHWFYSNTPIGNGNTSRLTVRFFGEYEGVYIVFVDGGRDYTPTETLENIGGYQFQYPTTQVLLAYNPEETAGSLRPLSQAYEAGWLSDSAVARLWNYYTNGVYEGNPNTDDGVWSLVTLLMSSGAALMMLAVYKRKYSV